MSKIDYKSNNDEVDIVNIYNFLLRRKLIIGGITFLGTLIGIIYSLLKEPIYSGYFQIIVEDSNNQGYLNKSSGSSFGDITNILSNNKNNVFNKTQESILKSPSVLKPVYEYVKRNYSKSTPELLNTSYQQWLMRYLSIEFEDGTNVLNIYYRNKNKEVILSTLNIISSKYQSYSKRDRERNINRGIKYLESQEKVFKSKSKESLKKLNKFSIENGLGDIDGFVELNDSSKINSMFKNDQISGQIFNNSFRDSNSIKNSGAGQRYENQFKILSQYEAQYTDLKASLKPNSKILQILENRIKNLKESLKRPNEILIEFRNLKRIAARDERLLADIENNLLALKLEGVRQQTPWELITEPTIDDLRISPKRKQITIISFIFAFLFGSSLAFLKEKKDDLIYEESDFNELIPFEYIDTWDKNEKELKRLIINNFYNENKTNSTIIGILNLSETNFKSESSSILEYISKELKSEIINHDKLVKISEYENILLIANEGNITFKKLKMLIKYLINFKSQKIGWILVKNNTLRAFNKK